jgi:hypothetical protein
VEAKGAKRPSAPFQRTWSIDDDFCILEALAVLLSQLVILEALAALPATADGGYDDIVPLDPSSIPDAAAPACRYGSLPTPQDPCLQFSTPLSNVHYSTVHSTAPIANLYYLLSQ